MRYIFDLIFGCTHTAHTWPQTKAGKTTVCCLECGKTLPYDFANLGGAPAQARAPHMTAPPVTVLDKPGTYRMETHA